MTPGLSCIPEDADFVNPATSPQNWDRHRSQQLNRASRFLTPPVPIGAYRLSQKLGLSKN